MFYASFGILAVIHHLILNYDILKNGRKQPKQGPHFRYSQFLNSILVFYIADIIWGFLEELKIRVLLYADTVLFFGTMALSVLLWTRYVVAFLDKQGVKAKSFMAAGWGIFGFVILHLIINFFYPVIFTITEDTEYIPESGRYILLAAQFLLFILITVYSLFVSIRSTGRDSIHYAAVCLSGGVMALLIVLQTFNAFVPFYTIGCFIANCLVHVFVEEDEKKEQEKIIKKQKHQITFTQIAESLALNYDVIYYVDTVTASYVGFTSNNIYGELKVNQSGDDFFGEAVKNISSIIHPKDRDRMLAVINRDYLLTALEGRKRFSIEYRLVVHEKSKHTRLIARKASDGSHFIICIENIDEEVRKEKEHLKALNTEKELARRDELTGTRNKTAFTELEQSVQGNIEKGVDYLPFAIAVCDLNDLKLINDSKGHKAGDEYIISCAKLLCDVFDHSPVFRIGGDEFAIFLSGTDFTSRRILMDKLQSKVMSNLEKKEGPVIAVGMAEYQPGDDMNVSDIFDRADHLMYENKRELKAHQESVK
ncbi:MAG: diguanylate cyclase [Lachnospiraceae bacterium]|nr:diguanylate cyclase [Lachnospiraceae bacterium]